MMGGGTVGGEAQKIFLVMVMMFFRLCDSLTSLIPSPDPGLSGGLRWLLLLLLLLLWRLWVFGSQCSSLLLAQQQASCVWVLAVVKRHMVDTLDVCL